MTHLLLLLSVVASDGTCHDGVYLKISSGIYLDVTLLVNQQVFRFQVSVDQIQSVQILEGQDNLSRIKPGVRLAAHTSTHTRTAAV